MARKSEVNLSRRVNAWLNKIPLTESCKRQAHPGMKGLPDITGTSHGFRIEFEGKIPGNKPSPKQYYYIKRFRAAGAITGVYYSLKAAQRLLYYQLKKRGITLAAEYFPEIRGEIEKNERRNKV